MLFCSGVMGLRWCPHVAGPAGKDDVRGRGIVRVRAADQPVKGSVEEPWIQYYLAVYAQPRDPTVGIDRESHMSPPVPVGHRKGVGGVTFCRGLLDDGLPVRAHALLGGGISLDRGRLDRDERRVVALEIRSVDDDSVVNSRCAEPCDAEVVTVVAAATGFPSAGDLSLVTDSFGSKNGASGRMR